MVDFLKVHEAICETLDRESNPPALRIKSITGDKHELVLVRYPTGAVDVITITPELSTHVLLPASDVEKIAAWLSRGRTP